MAPRKYFQYDTVRTGEDYSDTEEFLYTFCKKIIHKEITWDNLERLLPVHNSFNRVIDPLLHLDQNLFKVIQFCENNPNCVEIAIVKRNLINFYCGYHIFATCSADLESVFEVGSTFGLDKNVKVKCIINYGQEIEGSLEDFFNMIHDLRTDPGKWGILHKLDSDLYDRYQSYTFAEHKHLSFILDLRRYCGDISDLKQEADDIDSAWELQEYANEFHKNYVEPNTPPSRQIAWTFLLTMKYRYSYCKQIDKDLTWDNVKKWHATSNNCDTVADLFENIPSESTSKLPTLVSTDSEKATTAVEESHTLVDESSVTKLTEKMKSLNPSFEPATELKDAAIDEQLNAVISEYTSFLTKGRLLKQYENLVDTLNSSPGAETSAFCIYEHLFHRQITQEIKDPSSKMAIVLQFLFATLLKNGAVGSFSVPSTGGIKNTLLVVANNVKKTDHTDVRKDLFELIKGRSCPKTFIYSNFAIMYCDEIYTEKCVNAIDASKIFENIFEGANVDRIDGDVIEESAFASKAAEKWTEGVSAATRFLILSHAFLTHYYDTQDYRNVLSTTSKEKINVLIAKTTECLTQLESKDQNNVNDLKEKTEKVSPFLFQLANSVDLLLEIMPEAIDTHLTEIKTLNKMLSKVLDSKLLPKQSTV